MFLTNWFLFLYRSNFLNRTWSELNSLLFFQITSMLFLIIIYLDLYISFIIPISFPVAQNVYKDLIVDFLGHHDNIVFVLGNSIFLFLHLLSLVLLLTRLWLILSNLISLRYNVVIVPNDKIILNHNKI
jgi:hypothetical protein